jgi:hypothetical protein
MGKLQILVGDITSDEILEGHDCIVNPTNPRMFVGPVLVELSFIKLVLTN